MPKQLVNADRRSSSSLGVIALGVFLVALPLVLPGARRRRADRDGRADRTRSTRRRSTISRAEKSTSTRSTHRSPACARRSPPTTQLDDVFEVVARAATPSDVTITSVTAGDQVAVRRAHRRDRRRGRTGAAAPSRPTPADATARCRRDAAATDAAAATGAVGPQQVDFAITVTAGDMAQAAAFLDALRAGPRLLGSIQRDRRLDAAAAVDVTAVGADLRTTGRRMSAMNDTALETLLAVAARAPRVRRAHHRRAAAAACASTATSCRCPATPTHCPQEWVETAAFDLMTDGQRDEFDERRRGRPRARHPRASDGSASTSSASSARSRSRCASSPTGSTRSRSSAHRRSRAISRCARADSCC